MLCGKPNSIISANSEIELIISKDFFLVLSPATVYVRSAGLFSFLAFFSYKAKQNNLTILYIGLAILFQPIVKIYLGRLIWNIIDVLIAIFLITTIFIKKNKYE